MMRAGIAAATFTHLKVANVMKLADYRFVRLTENIEIPVPVLCTPEQEKSLIVDFLARNDLAKLENDCRELEIALREGSMIPLDQVIEELGIDLDTSKKTA